MTSLMTRLSEVYDHDHNTEVISITLNGDRSGYELGLHLEELC
jgi:hypothetical protein